MPVSSVSGSRNAAALDFLKNLRTRLQFAEKCGILVKIYPNTSVLSKKSAAKERGNAHHEAKSRHR